MKVDQTISHSAPRLYVLETREIGFEVYLSASVGAAHFHNGRYLQCSPIDPSIYSIESERLIGKVTTAWCGGGGRTIV